MKHAEATDHFPDPKRGGLTAPPQGCLDTGGKPPACGLAVYALPDKDIDPKIMDPNFSEI